MVRGSRLLVAVAAGLVAAGCGSSGAGTAASPSASPTAASKLTGSLTVLAAASLTEAFNDTKASLEKEYSGLNLTYSFAGSQALVTQVMNGAPADVIATADQTTMQKLVTASLVETPTVFARNKLEIVVAPGNPKAIKGLSDLAATGLTVVLADPSVPAGKFAAQALQKAGVTVTPKSLELDVKSVLQKVAMGEADAGIVYVTDVTAAGTTVAGVDNPRRAERHRHLSHRGDQDEQEPRRRGRLRHRVRLRRRPDGTPEARLPGPMSRGRPPLGLLVPAAGAVALVLLPLVGLLLRAPWGGIALGAALHRRAHGAAALARVLARRGGGVGCSSACPWAGCWPG